MSEELKNHLLYLMELFGGEVEGISKRFLRAILSTFVEKRILTEKDFQCIIDDCITEELLREEKTENNNATKLILTTDGKAFLRMIESELRYKTELKLAYHKFRTLTEEEKIDYINSLLQTLSDIEEYSLNRIVAVNSEYFVNAVLAKVSLSNDLSLITIQSYSYFDKSFNEKSRIREKLDKEFSSVGFDSILIERENSIDIIIKGNYNKKEIEDLVKKHGFKIEKIKQNISLEDLDNELIKKLIYNELKDFLLNQGLLKIGLTAKFIDFSRKSNQSSAIGDVDIFNGFDLKIRMNHNKKDEILIWINPTYIMLYTVFNYYQFLKSNYPDEKIKEKLIGVECKVLPKRTSAIITNIIFQNPDQDLIKYWSKNYRIKIRNNQFLVKVKFVGHEKEFPYPYPSDTLYVDKNWMENNIGYLGERKPLIFTPQERVNKIKEVLNDFIKSNISTKFIKLEHNNRLLNCKELKEKEFVKDIIKINPPKIRFSKIDETAISSDTRSIFRYEPYAGKKDIKLLKLFIPFDYDEEDIKNFFDTLCSLYKLHFGKLNIEDNFEDLIIKFDRKKLYNSGKFEQKDQLKRLLDSEVTDDQNGIILFIIPDEKNTIYSVIKEVLNNKWNIPDQILRESTFKEISYKGNISFAKALALQLYIKSLNFNESPWILVKPSDMKGKSVYVGFGFSMDPKTKKKANAVFAICDAVGKTVIQSLLGISYQGSRYLDENWLEKIFETLKSEFEKNKIEFKRFLLYKKGSLYKIEKEAINSFIKKIKNDDFWGNKEIEVVTLQDDICRIFKIEDGKFVNPEPGVVLIFNKKEAIICGSGHPEIMYIQGTTSPVLCKIETETKKNIKEISQEYYDRTYLNWMAPITTSKYPLEFNIANKLAEIGKEIYIKKEFSYIFV